MTSIVSTERVPRADLDVSESLATFVEGDALPDSGIDPERFWSAFSALLRDFVPRNRALLGERDRLQVRIDDYHRDRPGLPDPVHYRAFLEDIGYLVPEPEPFTITTVGVDDEIARLSGPQLVVPLLNARFAVNAVNARWGSLYDALYGTDAVADAGRLARGSDYNAERGAEVVRRGREVLDVVAPLVSGSHAEATAYRVQDGALVVERGEYATTTPSDPVAFAGHIGDPAAPSSVLLTHGGLHVEIVIDPQGSIGATDSAGVQDVRLESALTTIMDLEDSVAAVDAEDKVLGFRNWRELMRGRLTEVVTKNGRTFMRTMNDDMAFVGPDGGVVTVPGRSLMLVRNVGHLMTTDAVRDAAGAEIPEGILDAVMTALGALPDLRGPNRGGNSRTGSMYIVKPKMHGPEEVAFTVDLFGRVEEMLGLPPRTIKIGIMDEERRTTLNLRACIAAARDRIVFINTGFLDRTGDEIHTSLLAGPVVPKAQMRNQVFLEAYERANVKAGLEAGFPGRAQIGKGMWAMPDLMHAMVEQKIAHVRSGASTAWVPSPTAATLHAVHYHEVDTAAARDGIALDGDSERDAVLVPPLSRHPVDAADIATELDNNVQSILGYVVRWVDQGIGCSKVPDIHGIGLMEDRATLRISSQLLANWLRHGLIDAAGIDESLQRLAAVVDGQNASDPLYEPLVGPRGPGLAFQAARSLIVDGAAQPNGYTEPILHAVRRAKKVEQGIAR
ncbi:malate synthase G [Microbacterium sp. zg.B48]|uniref:malate synthase G n=1 Tax=Microbacterium sp. zg.B48 TaxID=2969408 RepID=UPI00214B9D1D|nr:malate synthase G [Microbacterium sp. zg.B48]MCR2764316.1 malate synthase G [Microbacterium sp. zg.B48]